MMAMDTNSEKEFAVIKFYYDDTYCTCSQKNKTADSAEFFIGKEVKIQWSKHEVYKGVVVFTDGNQFYYYFMASSLSIPRDSYMHINGVQCVSRYTRNIQALMT